MDRAARRRVDDSQLIWRIVRDRIQKAARKLPRPRRRPRFSDALIVAMYFWCVWHERPLYWACDRSHYGRLFRPRGLPSVSQFSRRIRTDRCQQILQRVHEDLSRIHLASSISFFDGKPVLVSPVSKDRDARRGRVSGGFAKGYKLHAWGTEDGRIPVWSVTPLNTGECPVAEALCRYIPVLPDDSLTLADTNYDSKNIGKLLARRNGRLLSMLKGAAKHPVTLRQMGPVRRELLGAWKHHKSLVRLVHSKRVAVENLFSRLGVTHPPAWVRGLERVRRWTGAKIILHHARLLARQMMQESLAA